MKYETFMRLMRQAADAAINGHDSFEAKLLGIKKDKELDINNVYIHNNNLTVECTLGDVKFKIELKDTRISVKNDIP